MNTFLRRLAEDIPLMNCSSLAWMVNATFDEKDVKLAEHPALKQMRGNLAPKVEYRKDIAVVPIRGALAYAPDAFEMMFSGVEDSRNVLAMIEEARASDAKGVLLAMDTPGGMMLGGPEMADAVAACSKEKPVVAHAGGLCASLGYMIASQATEIVASKSALVGSIGVISSVVDYSAALAQMGIRFDYFTNKDAKYKATGQPGTSLTADQRENLQAGVESAFNVFRSTVLEKRPQVLPSAMQGQTFRGADAKSNGLVDRVGDENFAIGVLRSHMRG